MKHFNEFLKSECGYRFETLEDMKQLCIKLNSMDYTWLSGKDLLDFKRLSQLYSQHKACKINTGMVEGRNATGLCWDESAKNNYLFSINEYEVDLI